MFLLKSKEKQSKRKHLSKEAFINMLYRGLKKIICGGFINIQNIQNIMKIQSGTERSNKLSWKV